MHLRQNLKVHGNLQGIVGRHTRQCAAQPLDLVLEDRAAGEDRVSDLDQMADPVGDGTDAGFSPVMPDTRRSRGSGIARLNPL